MVHLGEKNGSRPMEELSFPHNPWRTHKGTTCSALPRRSPDSPCDPGGASPAQSSGSASGLRRPLGKMSQVNEMHTYIYIYIYITNYYKKHIEQYKHDEAQIKTPINQSAVSLPTLACRMLTVASSEQAASSGNLPG